MSTPATALRWKIAAAVGALAMVATVVNRPQPPRTERIRRTATPAAMTSQPDPGQDRAPASDQGLSDGTGMAGVAPTHGHHRAGAADAAGDYVRALGAMVAMDPAAALAAQRSLASSAAGDELVADLAAKLARLHRAFPPGSLTYRVAPLAVRTMEESPDAVRADVWYAGVVSGPDLAPYEEWVTESYRLVWERHDWRVAAQASVPGPRPDPGRQTPDAPGELVARLAGFEALP